MITSVDQLYDDLQRIIALASGVTESRVILANQGRPPPKPEGDLYATYNPTVIRAYGQPRTSRTLVDATEPFNEPLLGAGWQDFDATTISQMELMVSCNFLNDGAVDAAWQMHSANHRWPILDALHTAGIGWRYCSDVRDLTGLYQAGLQPRYQLDWNVYVETAITDSVLRAASFSYTVVDENGNTIAQGDVS